MSYIQGNASTPLTRSVGRGRGRGMVLQFVSPVQGGDGHVMGGEQLRPLQSVETGFLLSATTLNLHQAYRLLLHPHRTLFHLQLM